MFSDMNSWALEPRPLEVQLVDLAVATIHAQCFLQLSGGDEVIGNIFVSHAFVLIRIVGTNFI